jgi:hypothetical protein
MPQAAAAEYDAPAHAVGAQLDVLIHEALQAARLQQDSSSSSSNAMTLTAAAAEAVAAPGMVIKTESLGQQDSHMDGTSAAATTGAAAAAAAAAAGSAVPSSLSNAELDAIIQEELAAAGIALAGGPQGVYVCQMAAPVRQQPPPPAAAAAKADDVVAGFRAVDMQRAAASDRLAALTNELAEVTLSLQQLLAQQQQQPHGQVQLGMVSHASATVALP